MARVQASQARSSLEMAELEEDYKRVLSKKRYAQLKAMFPVVSQTQQRLAEQKLAEQKHESQAQKFKTGPFIGISMGKLEDGDGVLITDIVNKSPADLTDLRIDDVILKIDNEVATSPLFVIQKLPQYKSGDRVTLTVRRGGKEMKIKLTLTNRNKFGPTSGYKAHDWVKKLEEMIAASEHPEARDARRSKPRVDGAAALLEQIVERLPERKIKRSGFKADIGIDLSKLETLGLTLDPTISQVEQLQPFVGLPSLKTANITDLTTEGAEFILSTKQQWPADMILEFYDDDWLLKKTNELRLRQWRNDANN